MKKIFALLLFFGGCYTETNICGVVVDYPDLTTDSRRIQLIKLPEKDSPVLGIMELPCKPGTWVCYWRSDANYNSGIWKEQK